MYKPIFFIQTIELSPDEILEGNKIIAKGIGMKFNNGTIYPFTKTSVWYNMYYQEPKFYDNYDWLMRAVEQIELTNININIMIDSCTTKIYDYRNYDFKTNTFEYFIDCTGYSKLESIFLAMVAYYNNYIN